MMHGLAKPKVMKIVCISAELTHEMLRM
jgi:hypothetical protein